MQFSERNGKNLKNKFQFIMSVLNHFSGTTSISGTLTLYLLENSERSIMYIKIRL